MCVSEELENRTLFSTAVIETSLTSGVAGHAVFVDALKSELTIGSPITTRYEWDFGDPEARFSHLVGWNAAHVYDDPGDYTIRLTLTDESGNSSTASTVISIRSEDRREIYVDPKGNDTRDGSSPGSAVRTPKRAAELLGDNSRLLFKRGATFNVNASLSINSRNVAIGAYGEGNDPILRRVKGSGSSIMALYGNADHVVIEDLVFDSQYVAKKKANKIPADGIFARGSNITIRDCEFRNLDDAINCNGKPAGLLVQDNVAPLETGIRGYFVWGEGSQHVYLGNTVANSTREHNIRTSGLEKFLIAHNTLSNIARGNVDKQDGRKGTIEVHKGAFAYVADNELHGGPLRAGPRGENVEPADTKTEWTVFEGNRTWDHDVMIFPGTHHLMMRNNIIHRDGANAINIRSDDAQGRSVSDIRIVNNTAISNATTGQFIKVGDSESRAVLLKNNLWVAPNLIAGTNAAAPVYIAGPDLHLFSEIVHNVWPNPIEWNRFGEGGIHYVWPTWSDARGYLSPQEWDAMEEVTIDHYARTMVDERLAPVADSVAATAGEPTPGVHVDIYGNARSTAGRWSAGAVSVG